MIASITPLFEMPGHFAAYPEREAAWLASMGAWSLQYGSSPVGPSHIAAHFGFVRLGICEAWVWCEWLQAHPNKEMLRLGLRTWNAFIQTKPWMLYGVCKNAKQVSFAQFLGFHFHEEQEDGQIVMRRFPGWDSLHRH